MSIETEPTAGELIANEASASARKKTAAAKPKGAPAPKTRKAAGRPPQSSRAKPDGEKLICRYCGSDDRWRDGAMVKRWAAAAFLDAEKSFRRILGYRDLWMLEAVLNDDQVAIAKRAA